MFSMGLLCNRHELVLSRMMGSIINFVGTRVQGVSVAGPQLGSFTAVWASFRFTTSIKITMPFDFDKIKRKRNRERSE